MSRNHDWNIAFDGVIQCQKCWKYVSEGIEGECYAEEAQRVRKNIVNRLRDRRDGKKNGLDDGPPDSIIRY